MKKKKDPTVYAAFLFIMTIVIYAIVSCIKVQEANKITSSFAKIPLETKIYIFPWILIFLFIGIVVCLHFKKK
jgi:hypothetical protein